MTTNTATATAATGGLAPAPPGRADAAGPDPHRVADGAGRGPRPRLRDHAASRGEERRRPAPEPRFGIPDAADARGRRPRPLDRAGGQAGLRAHRRRPHRGDPSHRRSRRPPVAVGRGIDSAYGQLREGRTWCLIVARQLSQGGNESQVQRVADIVRERRGGSCIGSSPRTDSRFVGREVGVHAPTSLPTVGKGGGGCGRISR